MPDGSVQLTSIDAACARMHERLICWGRLVLRCGNGPRQQWDSDSEREYWDYTARQYDDAEKVIGPMVRQLPKRQQSLTLAAFYVDDKICSVWADLGPHRRWLICDDIARTVNKALRRINRDQGTDWLPIVPGDVDGIRLRAIRQLVNREGMGLTFRRTVLDTGRDHG